MKSLFRIFALWGVLATLSLLMAYADHSEALRALAAGGLFVLPPLAVWLTVSAVEALPGLWYGRLAFWIVTASGWLAVLLLAQNRYESPMPEHRENLSLALGLFTLTVLWLAIKARSLPPRRVFCEVAASLVILAVAIGAFAWRYDATTGSIAAQAEARWAEIGLPMAEFEKTLAAGQENAGSAVFRQVLRDRVGSRFYKEGTAAADKEPAVTPSEIVDALCTRAATISGTELAKADDFDFAEPTGTLQRIRAKKAKFDGSIPDSPMLSAEEIEAASRALDADYRRILAEEPPVWAADPHDAYLISVPNFLGVRKFAQLASADALRRLANGDEEGAARAIAAGLRIAKPMRDHPTLVSLMIHVTVEGMLTTRQVRLPATEDGWPSVARDAAVLRAEFLKRMQMESWAQLHTINNTILDPYILAVEMPWLPHWARRIGHRRLLDRQLALGALNGAGHAAVYQSPATLALPDLGRSLHEAVSAQHPSIADPNFTRAAMRIEATLLLREQAELIRNTRARLAAGRAVESRDSGTLPGVRWELIADAEKNTVATRLVGAPAWVTENSVTTDSFWLLPLDGSVAWQFHPRVPTASR